MTTYFKSLKSAIYGKEDKADVVADNTKDNVKPNNNDEDAKHELAQKLVGGGVSEKDALKAVNMCPWVKHSGQDWLLLSYMINFEAKETEAVQAMFMANGDPHETIRLHEETFLAPRRHSRVQKKRLKMIKELVEKGIDEQEAKEMLILADWDLEEASEMLARKQQREMKMAQKEYLAKKQKFQKLTHGPSKAKVHRARSAKVTKPSRYASKTIKNKSKKQQNYKTSVELSDSEDDALDSCLNTISFEEEEEKSGEYHSSDDSDVEMTQEDDSDNIKPAETRKEQPVPVKTDSSSKTKSNSGAPEGAVYGEKVSVKNKIPKMKVFQLRKRISVQASKPLVKALLSLPNKSVDEFQTLKNSQGFCSGPPAEFLDILIHNPSLFGIVIKTLQEKVENNME